MSIWYKLKRWWRNYRNPPVVVIRRYGQMTESPKVGVSVASTTGSQGVYDFDDNEIGNAKATMYGKGLAQVMQRRLVDDRNPPYEP